MSGPKSAASIARLHLNCPNPVQRRGCDRSFEMHTVVQSAGVEGSSMDSYWPQVEWVNNHRRLVLTSLVLFVICLAVVRLFVLTPGLSSSSAAWAGLWRDLIDGVLSTVLVSAVVASFLWWMGPKPERIPPGAELAPDGIGRALQINAVTTESWEYVGHTGRYFRSQILPQLGEQAKALGRTIPARVVIIDPTSRSTGTAYCAYRKASRSTPYNDADWSLATLQSELVGTILAILVARAQSPNVIVSLGVVSNISVFRYDRSDRAIVVTQEDPQQPAFIYPRGSRFYDYYRKECDLAWAQARILDLRAAPPVDLSDPASARTALQALFGDRSDRIEKSVPKAITAALALKSPYA